MHIEHQPKFTPQSLLSHLQSLNFEYQLHTHQALHSVEDAILYKRDLEGTYVKNLFLQDRDENLYLITCLNQREIDLQKLRAKIGCRRLSFASSEKMWFHLGVKPGSVSPLALLNTQPGALTFFADQAMTLDRINNFHPLTNEMTIQMLHHQWTKLIENHGFHIHWLNFDEI
jgi:Ala-tRNA(Pro) deacylase